MSARGWRALFAVAVVALLSSGALSAATHWKRRIDRAAQSLSAGRPASALRLSTVPAEHATQEAYYLRGTALLALDRDAEAVGALSDAAARGDDVELRRRALHNLALAHLRLAAAAARPGRDVQARGSVLAGREALRLRSAAPATRWNLAMAQRLAGPARQGPSPDDGGVSVSVSVGAGAADAGPGERGPMSRADALRILDALRSDEAGGLGATLARRMGGGGANPSGGGPPW